MILPPLVFPVLGNVTTIKIILICCLANIEHGLTFNVTNNVANFANGKETAKSFMRLAPVINGTKLFSNRQRGQIS
jgi:hypothetical protein